METITQTNRTLLFAEINPERKNILDRLQLTGQIF